MSNAPDREHDRDADELPSDPEAPGTYVDDDTAAEVPEPNEPA